MFDLKVLCWLYDARPPPGWMHQDWQMREPLARVWLAPTPGVGDVLCIRETPGIGGRWRVKAREFVDGGLVVLMIEAIGNGI